MILSSDCVRDVLLAIENCAYGEHPSPNALCEKLTLYSFEDVNYTCLKLGEGGFIDIIKTKSLNDSMPVVICVQDLTFRGHEFLNDIREQSNWEKVRETAKKAGVFSLKSLVQIAGAVAGAAITSALQ